MRNVMRHVHGCDDDHIVSPAGIPDTSCKMFRSGIGLVPHQYRDNPGIRIDVLDERDLHLNGMFIGMCPRYVRNRCGQSLAYPPMDRTWTQRCQMILRTEYAPGTCPVMIGSDDHVRVWMSVLCQCTVRMRRHHSGTCISRMGNHHGRDPAVACAFPRKSRTQRVFEAPFYRSDKIILTGWIETPCNCRLTHKKVKGV